MSLEDSIKQYINFLKEDLISLEKNITSDNWGTCVDNILTIQDKILKNDVKLNDIITLIRKISATPPPATPPPATHLSDKNHYTPDPDRFGISGVHGNQYERGGRRQSRQSRQSRSRQSRSSRQSRRRKSSTRKSQRRA